MGVVGKCLTMMGEVNSNPTLLLSVLSSQIGHRPHWVLILSSTKCRGWAE